MSVAGIVSSSLNSLFRKDTYGNATSGASFADVFQNAASAQTEGTSATSSTNPSELGKAAESRLSEFTRNLKQVLSENGVDLSWEVRIESDGAGGFQIDDSHPDADKIKKALQDNPDLAEKFKQLQDTYRRLRSQTEAVGTDETSAPPFHFSLKDNEVTAGFN